MQCEKCGSDVWDNRQKNEQRVANGQKPFPIFKCKDQECGWVKWPPKGQAPARANGNAPSVRSTRPLGPLYYECVRIASGTIAKLIPNAQAADIIAGAATLFIGATNTGAPLVNVSAPKPVPKPPPPPPPSDDFDDEPAGMMPDDQDLPF